MSASKWWIIAAVVAGLVVISNAIDNQSPSRPTYDAPTFDEPDEPATVAVTADMVVDTLGAATITRMCDAYDELLQYLSPSAAHAAGVDAFSTNYHHTDPSAEEVFDEILSRC
jgi:hypothetical protein